MCSRMTPKHCTKPFMDVEVMCQGDAVVYMYMLFLSFETKKPATEAVSQNRYSTVQPLTLFWSLLYILACTAKSVLVLLSIIPHWKARTIRLEPGRPNLEAALVYQAGCARRYRGTVSIEASIVRILGSWRMICHLLSRAILVFSPMQSWTLKRCGSIVRRRRGRKAHDIGYSVGRVTYGISLEPKPVLNPLKFRRILNPFPIIVVQFVIATFVPSVGGAF